MKKWFKDYGPILIRNIASLITLIISLVIILLVIFGEFRDALFISSVLFLNIIIGIIQEFRAKSALEKLKALIVQKIVKVRMDGTEEIILVEEIQINDRIRLKLGDQIPCDGKVIESNGLEANEALLTGESDNINKKIDDMVYGGSIVAAGSALIEVESLPANSLISRMTEKIKKYDFRLSPIQKSTINFIKYMSYVLIFIVGMVILRGLVLKHDMVSIVIEIAALAGTLVPEGLVLATTILFSYGAVRLFRSKVLLQEINATEGLSRVKNLCVDKTGTLTENEIRVEGLLLGKDFNELEIKEYVHGYIDAINDTSETAKALREHFKFTEPYCGEIKSILPFSSNRKYGMAEIKINDKINTVLVGAPDILLHYVCSPDEQSRLKENIDQYSAKGKRLLLIAVKIKGPAEILNDGDEVKIAGLFVLHNPLREGTKEIIEFFQERGVTVRVISGDNPKTVQTIAKQSGIQNTEIIITGDEIENTSDEVLKEKAKGCSLFARVKPHHKERLVDIFKHDGFTAMIGDGANDALAIKKSDLGIAMFDGASATKQIARVILVNNKFSALPMGVQLADSIITTIEMVASIFFNKVGAGLSLLFILGIFGYTYPVSPRNMTLINYFTIGLPIFYWSIFPAIKKRSIRDSSFLLKVAPFSILNGILVAIATTIMLMIMVHLGHRELTDDFTVVTYITLGFWFFINVPAAYDLILPGKQKIILFITGLLVIGALFVFFNVTYISKFFGVEKIPLRFLLYDLIVLISIGYLQYILIKRKIAEKIIKRFFPGNQMNNL